jgi:hypothetical protein
MTGIFLGNYTTSTVVNFNFIHHAEISLHLPATGIPNEGSKPIWGLHSNLCVIIVVTAYSVTRERGERLARGEKFVPSNGANPRVSAGSLIGMDRHR